MDRLTEQRQHSGGKAASKFPFLGIHARMMVNVLLRFAFGFDSETRAVLLQGFCFTRPWRINGILLIIKSYGWG
jgi:hypothetical protein